MLLEYSLGSLRSYVWVVTRDGVTAATLPGRGDIETAARALSGKAPLDALNAAVARGNALLEKHAPK